MAIRTDNVTGQIKSDSGKVWVRMIKATHVSSAGRDVRGGEEIEVSEEDARFLIVRNKAERLARKPERTEKVAEVTAAPKVEETEEVEAAAAEEAVETAPEVEEEPVRRFPGRRRRSR